MNGFGGWLFAGWMRRPDRIRAGTPLAAVVALFTCLYVLWSTMTLSGPQLRDRELGSSDFSVTVGSVGAARSPTTTEVVSAMVAAGARDVRVMLIGSDFLVDGLRTTGLATGPQDRVTYWQWQHGDRPTTISMLSGHWPRHPGEVMISSALADLLSHPQDLDVFSATSRVHVVGGLS